MELLLQKTLDIGNTGWKSKHNSEPALDNGFTKSLFTMLASHVGMLVLVLAPLLLILLPDDAPARTATGGLNSWTFATHMGNSDGISGCWLLFDPATALLTIWEETSRALSLSLLFTLSLYLSNKSSNSLYQSKTKPKSSGEMLPFQTFLWTSV